MSFLPPQWSGLGPESSLLVRVSERRTRTQNSGLSTVSVTALPGDPGLAALALLESNSQSVEEVMIVSISSQDGGDFVHWCLEMLTSLDEGIYKF